MKKEERIKKIIESIELINNGLIAHLINSNLIDENNLKPWNELISLVNEYKKSIKRKPRSKKTNNEHFAKWFSDWNEVIKRI